MTSPAPTSPTVTTARTDVRRAGAADADGVTAALADAFSDDPVFTWLFPDARRRAPVTREFFAVVVAELARHDETWTTDDAVTGAALWVPPGRPAVAEDRAAPSVPGWQRSGDPAGERADRARTPAYLDATSARSRDMYARHGFRAAPEISVPGGPPLWPMWRDPA